MSSADPDPPIAFRPRRQMSKPPLPDYSALGIVPRIEENPDLVKVCQTMMDRQKDFAQRSRLPSDATMALPSYNPVRPSHLIHADQAEPQPEPPQDEHLQAEPVSPSPQILPEQPPPPPPSSSTTSPPPSPPPAKDNATSAASPATTEPEQPKEELSVYSKQILLQIVFQHLQFAGLRNTVAELQAEAGIKFSMCDVDSSLLKQTVDTAVRNEPSFLQTLGDKLGEKLNTVEEVAPLSSIDDSCDLDVWSEPPDTPGANVMYVREGSGLRAASLNKLIERLTSQGASADTRYLKTFLATYRSFTTPHVLLSKLIRRFDVPVGSAEKPSQIKLRVINVMKQWMENYIHDFDPTMVRDIRLFVDDALSVDELTKSWGRQLSTTLAKKLSGKELNFEAMKSFSTDPPAPKVPELRALLSGRFDILQDMDSEEVARQLTLIEYSAYKKIKCPELLNQAWNKSKLRHRSPNVCAMIQRFNVLSKWVATRVVTPMTLAARAKAMTGFIKIAIHCRHLNNFNSMMAILAGLELTPVFRLKFTRGEVKDRHIASYEEMKALMSPEGAFKNYREKLKSVPPPLIPYLGVYLTDLTFIEDGNVDFLTTESGNLLINWAKRNLVYSVISEIQVYQNTPYNILPVVQIQSQIETCIQDHMEEEELYKLSLVREPRKCDRESLP